MTARLCDECGRTCAAWKRVYRGRGYCATCYAREFELRTCPSCRRQARLPRRESEALCRVCARQRSCARCGATDYEIGRFTIYGPVCNACARYFREKRPCAFCGTPSFHLSRVLRLGVEVQICPKCQRADHGTCALCRRNRKVQIDTLGRKVCRACRESGIVPCPKCGEPMPAGRGKQCEACYWGGLLERRATISCEAFQTADGRDLFQQFAVWLLSQVGPQKAAQHLNRYLDFFLQLSSLEGNPLDVGLLLEHFTTQGLRRNLLPMRFLEKTAGILISKKAKEDASECRRILDLLRRFPSGSLAARLLDGYREKLEEKVRLGTTTLRSVRLALSPASALLMLAAELRRMPPDQVVLDAFLKRAPGQRAAVSGFVYFLHERCVADVKLPKRSPISRQDVEHTLATMVVDGINTDQERKRALALALTYFHGISAGNARKMANISAIAHDDHGSWALVHRHRRFVLPSEFASLLVPIE